MSTPGDLLLAKLIATYRREHQRYADIRRGPLLGSLLWLVIAVGPILYVFRSARDGSSILIFTPVICALSLISNRWKLFKAKKTLDRLKAELEDVGIRIACNQRYPHLPSLEILEEGASTDNHVLLPIYLGTDFQPKIRGIDFAQYNKLFRI